jgi:hypothetical protein
MSARKPTRAIVKGVVMIGRQLGLIDSVVAEFWILLLGLRDA